MAGERIGSGVCLGTQCPNYWTSLENGAPDAEVRAFCEARGGSKVDGSCETPVITGVLGGVRVYLEGKEQ